VLNDDSCTLNWYVAAVVLDSGPLLSALFLLHLVGYLVGLGQISMLSAAVGAGAPAAALLLLLLCWHVLWLVVHHAFLHNPMAILALSFFLICVLSACVPLPLVGLHRRLG